MPPEAVADNIVRRTSAELRIGVWRRVMRGVAHDLLNVVMPLRSLAAPLPPGGGDPEGRTQLAKDTAARVTAIGVTLHRLEASLRDDGEDEQTGRWPMFREVVRWAVPRGVRIQHDESRVDLGSVLTPQSASLAFWTMVFCGELLEPDEGEVGLEMTPEALLLHLPGPLKTGGQAVQAEAWTALQELASEGFLRFASDPASSTPTVAVRVSYSGGPADLPRRTTA